MLSDQPGHGQQSGVGDLRRCGLDNAQPAGPCPAAICPDNPLSVFHGKDARGTWTFSVQDAVANTSGMLHFFALDIDGLVGGTAAAASVDDFGEQGTEALTASPPTAPVSIAAATMAVSSVDAAPPAAPGTALPSYLFLGTGSHQSSGVEQVSGSADADKSRHRLFRGRRRPRRSSGRRRRTSCLQRGAARGLTR